MLQSLFSSQILTLGLVIVVLFSMFLILFKSLKVSIIALLPNLLSIGSVLGIMGSFFNSARYDDNYYCRYKYGNCCR